VILRTWGAAVRRPTKRRALWSRSIRGNINKIFSAGGYHGGHGEHRGPLFWAVFLGLLGSGVEDLKLAVEPGGEFQIETGVGPLGIGNEFRGDIVSGAALVGVVELPEIIQAGRLLNDVPN